MAFDFKAAFNAALESGLDAAKAGGDAAESWVRESAKANEATLRSIAEGVSRRQISNETAEHLLRLSGNALRAEAAALSAILVAATQAGINAFIDSLFASLKAALKLAI